MQFYDDSLLGLYFFTNGFVDIPLDKYEQMYYNYNSKYMNEYNYEGGIMIIRMK